MTSGASAALKGDLFGGYDTGAFFDEMFLASGEPRPHYAKLFQMLGSMRSGQFDDRRNLADIAFLLQGITFTVYSDGTGTERLFPFDLIPRILPHSDWSQIERGLSQRVVALNLFLQDIYGQQRILKEKKIPRFADLFVQTFFARDDRRRRAARDLYPHLRHRPGARLEDGRVPGARR